MHLAGERKNDVTVACRCYLLSSFPILDLATRLSVDVQSAIPWEQHDRPVLYLGSELHPASAAVHIGSCDCHEMAEFALPFRYGLTVLIEGNANSP